MKYTLEDSNLINNFYGEIIVSPGEEVEWNKIMELVDRICSDEYSSITIDQDGAFVHYKLGIPCGYFKNEEFGSKKQSAYKAVIEFINWYNNQQSK